MLRGPQKNNGLDEKGIFGAICRHNFPIAFMDMKHNGERYIIVLKSPGKYLSNDTNLTLL